MTQLLTFQVGDLECAVPFGSVREIVPCTEVAPVTTAPAFVRGLASLRGAPLPVVDLALKLGRPQTELNRFTCLVVADGPYRGTVVTLGLLVHAASRVLDVGPEELLPAPPFAHGARLDHLSAVVRSEGGFVLVLDLGVLFSSDEVRAMVSMEELRQALEGGGR